MDSPGQPSDKDIFARALELQEEEQAKVESQEARAALAVAAEELGVSPEFLVRAERQLREQNAAEILDIRARRARTLRILLALAALAVLASFFYRAPPPMADGPWSNGFDSMATDWTLVSSPGTEASSSQSELPSRSGKVGGIWVERFDAASAPKGRYYVNLRAQSPPETIRGYETLSLWTLGDGLDEVRVYFRIDPKSRWRSPPISAGPTWSEQVVPLAAFEYQERSGKGSPWKLADPPPLGRVERLQLKVGYFVNPPEATGSIFFDDLQLLP